ncbi:hypothetical protein OPS25_11415 [Alteromonas ponticola]|uniref:GHKL domain-containing protein n=1 Tax=Alteromonas aquimaris TaxID=2998417 RepID=A0ABT3P8K6_9ALTE|nr:hypothetical protein [Alteromonas aquimaris]MCW8109105.1 hypothetical protein [Alteromonas aquimaris]
MAFIHSYLAIQKIRFEDKIEIDTRIDKTVMEEEVPFMLLHTLVENAVQHGSQLESNRNLLRLTIEKSTRQLEIVLTNQACKKKGHAGFGIGLEVSKKRLHHLYGREDLLTSHTSADGVYTTRLTIPIRGNDV